jgi:hypothetical protein
MKKINTIFDYERSEPQISAIYDTDAKTIEFIPLYLPGIKTTLRLIRDGARKLRSVMESDCIVNDALSHIVFMHKYRQDVPINAGIHEARQPRKVNIESLNHAKKELIKGIKQMPSQISPWMSVKAKSSIVYSELMTRGVMWGPRIEYPKYDTNTLTGRSRTRGFNIQGTTESDPLRHIDLDRSKFICFDWVSADLRMAGHLSHDQFINDSFKQSDPYTELERLLGDRSISRDDCKIETLKSIYSVDLDGPLLDLMPQLKQWMQKKRSDYEYEMFRTILGMPIPSIDLKSSFNGIIQGSVAESMQSVLIKIAQCFEPRCILAEIHDSLIVACADRDVKRVIANIVPMMMRPLDSIDLIFPTKVSIGNHWKQWKTYKVFR